MVLAIASVALFMGELEGEWWTMLACVYVGANAFQKYMEVLAIKNGIVPGSQE